MLKRLMKFVANMQRFFVLVVFKMRNVLNIGKPLIIACFFCEDGESFGGGLA